MINPNMQPHRISPNVISFLPMLYVAWADAILTPEEIDTIRKKIKAQPWLSEEEKSYLFTWLDPASKPDAEAMQQWLQWFKKATATFGEKDKFNLAALGAEIAGLQEADKHIPLFRRKEALKALGEIEQILGVIGHEATKNLRIHLPAENPNTGIDPFPSKGWIQELNMYLDKSYYEFRQEIKKFLEKPEFSKTAFAQKDEYRAQVLEWVQKLADKGWGGLAFPKEFGGIQSMGAYMALFETLGYHDLSLTIKFGVQFGLFGGSVYSLGTEKHHRKYLKDIGSLSIPGCFAMTEEDHGSNVRDIQTIATYHPEQEQFIIHTPDKGARKTYIGNAALHGKMATVFAQLYTGGVCHGVHAFLVPIRDSENKPLPGVNIEDCGEKLGLNGVDNGRIWFDQVTVPLDHLLDRFASVHPDGSYESNISNPDRRFFTMLGTLVGGRVCVPMAGLSACKRGLALAVKYAFHRRQFGKDEEPETRIIEYQTHQLKLLPAMAKTFALHFTHQYLADRYLHHSEDEIREIEALAAGLKAVSTWHTTATLQTCREACGGNGYLAENFFAALKGDTDIFTTFEGDNTVLLQLTAKSRLSEFKQQFHEIKLVGLLNYVAKGAATTLTELNPIVVRWTQKEHLFDPEFHMAAFRYREQRTLQTVATRLKSRIDQGMDSYDAFIECQQHLVEMAKAYINRIILESFQKAVEEAPESLQDILQRVYLLYALNELESDKAYWLEAGYMEGIKTKAIRRYLLELCASIKDDALSLTEAWGLPAFSLEAPMFKR